MNARFSLLVFALLFYMACQPETTNTESDESSSEFIYGLKADENRPYDPWVFRSVLDSRPRMITLTLHNELFCSYSTQTCGLYKAWKGYVNFEGAVYNTAHGPQPFSIGNAYMIDAQESPWKVVQNGQDVDFNLQYRGHRFVEDGRVELMYEFTIGDSKAMVYESPEVRSAENARVQFERRFTTENVPEGTTIQLMTRASGIYSADDVTSDDHHKVTESNARSEDGVEILDLELLVTLESNATTTLSYSLSSKGMITNPNNALINEEELAGNSGKDLIGKNDCKSCHNTFAKTIGPSYKEIAKRYPTSDESAFYLVNKIRNGGSGIWGSVPMTAHPELSKEDARMMVDYILSLDPDDVAENKTAETIAQEDYLNGSDVDKSNLLPGAVVKIYEFDKPAPKIPDFSNMKMIQAGIMGNFDNISEQKFKELSTNFGLTAEGFIDITKEDEYTFRIWSDDGSNFYLNGEKIVDNDGLHSTGYKEQTVGLKEGVYPFKVEYYQGAGGSFLSLNWKSKSQESFEVIPKENILHNPNDSKSISGYSLPMSNTNFIPGDGSSLDAVHPSFAVTQARPDQFLPKVGGLDVLADGRVILSTWDPSGSVYIIDHANSGDPSKMRVKKIATGIAEPLGVKVVGDDIYIMQKQEMTQLIDHDGDEIIDEYRTICNSWKVSNNFHEFGFGLEEKDDYLYATLAIGIMPGGASANPQPADRGKVIKVHRKTGELEFVASGLRTPNGIGLGYNNEIFVADNQGDWLPASKILHVTEGAFFNSRAVDFEGTADKEVKQPLVWLPQDEIGNSPSTPSSLNVGPYKNQMIHCEVTHGGLKRVFVEEVNGEFQGALFRFTQGLEAGINRIAWADNENLYVGGIGNPGNWGQTGKLWYGLQRFSYTGDPCFEMLALRAKSNGIEIEFTEALKADMGWNPEDYKIQQYYYKPTIEYGGPKMDLQDMKVKSATVSDDRKRVFLEIPNLKAKHVVYLQLVGEFVSDQDHDIWSTESWYTMNNIPTNSLGEIKAAPAPIADNTLSPAEKAAGWKLLFDGESLDGWRNYRKETIGSSWKAENGELFLSSIEKPEGGWQAIDGGDIVTDEIFEDFEFSMEWKISNCGNSGIIYNVVEDEANDYTWSSGPEMQILDNSCHPDARFHTHKAGDLYDFIATKYMTVKPAGEWNHIRIISNNGKIQQWQNGYKVVEYDINSEEWAEMVKKSKFKDTPSFAKSASGHIALQDHGDPVFFKNIKIREL